MTPPLKVCLEFKQRGHVNKITGIFINTLSLRCKHSIPHPEGFFYSKFRKHPEDLWINKEE